MNRATAWQFVKTIMRKTLSLRQRVYALQAFVPTHSSHTRLLPPARQEGPETDGTKNPPLRQQLYAPNKTPRTCHGVWFFSACDAKTYL
jgi:hypothetical protein